MEEYRRSVEILKLEIQAVSEFSESKNWEIEQMMPPEFDKFNIETRNFFATQQGENFKLKKELVGIEREV